MPTFPPPQTPQRVCSYRGDAPQAGSPQPGAPLPLLGSSAGASRGRSWDFGDVHRAREGYNNDHLPAELAAALQQVLHTTPHQKHLAVPRSPSDPSPNPLGCKRRGFGAILLRRQAQREPQEGRPVVKSLSHFYSRPPIPVLPPAFGGLSTKRGARSSSRPAVPPPEQPFNV